MTSSPIPLKFLKKEQVPIEIVGMVLKGDKGDIGDTPDLNYSDVDPTALGFADPGIAETISRGDHAHPLPDYSAIPNTPNLADVALSGAYADLSGKPVLDNVALSGSYNDLSDTPNLADVALSGAYTDLTGAPGLATQSVAGLQSAVDKGLQDRGRRVLAPVKWFYLTSNSAYYTAGMVGVGNYDYYNTTTKRITATSNVALTAPREYLANNNDWAEPPTLVGSASDVLAGYSIGDRVLWADNIFNGCHGVYTIIDIGQDGVRPYILELVPELQTLSNLVNGWEVYLPQGADNSHRARFTMNFAYGSDIIFGIMDIETGLNSCALASGNAIGNYSVSIGAGSETRGTSAISIGFYAQCHENSGIAIGNNALSEASNGIALGWGTRSGTGYSAAAIGNFAKSNAFGLTVIDGVKGAALMAFCGDLAASRQAHWNDVGAILTSANTSNITYTIPLTATDDPDFGSPQPAAIFPVGCSITIIQGSTGTITVAAGAGVTVQGPILSTRGLGTKLQLDFDGDIWWVSTSDITISNATQSTAGLQSPADKAYQDRSIKVFAPVKWFWVNLLDTEYGIPGADDYFTAYYNPATFRITATSNIAIPAPAAYDENGAHFTDPPVPVGSAANVALGYQVGDRLLWTDQYNKGQHGIYTIIDVGQNGVRPYVLELIPELRIFEERRKPWKVYMEIGLEAYSWPYATSYSAYYDYAGINVYGMVAVGSGSNAIVEGDNAVVKARNAIAIGFYCFAGGYSATALGNQCAAYSNGGAALGSGCEVFVPDSAAIGILSKVRSGQLAAAFGILCEVYAERAVAVGSNALARAFGVTVVDGAKGAALMASCLDLAASRSATWSDVGAILTSANTSDITYTIPLTASDVPDYGTPSTPSIFPRGCSITIIQGSTGTITVAAGASVTVAGPLLTTQGRGTKIELRFDGDIWWASTDDPIGDALAMALLFS